MFKKIVDIKFLNVYQKANQKILSFENFFLPQKEESQKKAKFV